MSHREALLLEFYRAWERCEGGRGCYSCTPTHDCRCEKENGISETCTCGRENMDQLSLLIDVEIEAVEKRKKRGKG